MRLIFPLVVCLSSIIPAAQDGGIPGFPKAGQAFSAVTGGGVPDFATDLQRPGVFVVYGTFTKITEGKKERMKEADAKLGEGNFSLSMIGTVYYKIEATAEIAAAQVFCGAKSEKLTVSFPMQLAKLNDGTERLHVLAKSQVQIELGSLGVFVLEAEKGKKTLRILQFEKYEMKDGTKAVETHRAKAADHYAMNRRVADLKTATEQAAKLVKKDKAQAQKILSDVLNTKVTYSDPALDAVAAGRIGPFEKRAQEMLDEVGGAQSAPSDDNKKGEKPPM